MKIIVITLLGILFSGTSQTQPIAELILEKTINYHDPAREWGKFNNRLFLSTEIENKEVKTTVEIDNSRGFFKSLEPDKQTEVGIEMDSCFVIQGAMDCDKIKRTRNYYLYLWGLPMKLMDAGTELDTRVKEEEFSGFSCYVLKVSYQKDVWYFFIDKTTYALRGYSFYFDEPTKKGEVIYLEDEMIISKMKIPKIRKWYKTDDGKYLGTDVLIKFEDLTK